MGRIIAIHNLLLRRLRIPIFVTASVLIASLASATADEERESFVSIGSGGMTAVYYPVAKAMCKAAFLELRAQGIRCSAEMTPGSVYNLEHVVSGELELGIVQSDILFSAYKGIDGWDGKPVTEVRSVLSLYPELVTVVARADANIHVLADLASRRVNVGSVAAGARTTWNLISGHLPLTAPVRLTELNQDETTSALCRGAIDANFFVVGHPSQLVSKWLAECPSNFVAVRESVVDKLVSKYPFYTRGFIPTELYRVPDRILSFGPLATLVTSASSDPRVVAAIAKAIITHVDELKTMHPALAELDAKRMVARTLTAAAPLHPAAAAVYKELGLLK
jgi:TRAP transporter TAXI family solute receptor